MSWVFSLIFKLNFDTCVLPAFNLCYNWVAEIDRLLTNLGHVIHATTIHAPFLHHVLSHVAAGGP